MLFPEPDTPVTAVMTDKGSRTLMFFRLCSAAFKITSQPFGLLLSTGTGIHFSPFRYCDVRESREERILSNFPSATLYPPSSPAPGPKSRIKSAERMVCSSCSTTMMEFPSSLMFLNKEISRLLSLWWRPIVGSSRT